MLKESGENLPRKMLMIIESLFRSRSLEQQNRFRKLKDEFSETVKTLRNDIEKKVVKALENVARQKTSRIENIRWLTFNQQTF